MYKNFVDVGVSKMEHGQNGCIQFVMKPININQILMSTHLKYI
jgi:hypothetical protein